MNNYLVEHNNLDQTVEHVQHMDQDLVEPNGSFHQNYMTFFELVLLKTNLTYTKQILLQLTFLDF